jgi:acyl carrier protein
MSTSPHRTVRAGDDAVSPRLREIVADVADLDPGEVAAGASFYDDLGVDSVQKLEIVVRTERLFGVRLTDLEAAELGSVADAVRLLRAKGVGTP